MMGGSPAATLFYGFDCQTSGLRLSRRFVALGLECFRPFPPSLSSYLSPAMRAESMTESQNTGSQGLIKQCSSPMECVLCRAGESISQYRGISFSDSNGTTLDDNLLHYRLAGNYKDVFAADTR
jgi:hypothetical protein